MIDTQRLIDDFMTYVQIDSPSCYEGEFALHLLQMFKALDIEATMDHAGDSLQSNAGNIIAKIKGNLPGPPILFSAHMDTVSPGKDIEPVISEGFIHSNNQTILGADDKAGVACIIEAITTIIENNLPHRDLEIVFTIFEEGGLNGAKHFEPHKLSAEFGFVLDSGAPPGHIITKGPAQNKLTFTVKGMAAHAGISPEKGISAISVASEAIHRMDLLRIDEETTANIGLISGGIATNIVMPEVTVVAEARSLNEEKLNKQTQHMVECFEDAVLNHNATFQYEVQKLYPSLAIPDDAPVIEHAKRAFEACNMIPVLTHTGGGSDAHIFTANGIPTVNLGLGVRQGHTVYENIAIADLVKMAEIALSLMTH